MQRDNMNISIKTDSGISVNMIIPLEMHVKSVPMTNEELEDWELLSFVSRHAFELVARKYKSMHKRGHKH